MADKKPKKSAAKAKAAAKAETKSKVKAHAKGAAKDAAKEPAPAALPSRRNAYIAFIVVLSAIIAVWKFYLGPKLSEPFDPRITANVESVGAPKIGGPFTLIDHNGRTVTEADFKGKYALIYFGYTFCPDVCPTSLTIMSDALDMLGDKADKVTPVFITVDPERDTPEYLKIYVEHFHPRLVGLTGSVEQVIAAAKAYKVYYAKVGDAYEDDEYTMDHSSFTYLMGPDGAFVAHFRHGAQADEIAKKLAEFL